MSEYLPGLEGVPATQSNISDLDGVKGILTYRGYRIEDLAINSTFEETSLLLLDGQLPSQAELDQFDHELRANRVVKYNVREIMKYLPATGHPMEMLQTAVASLGMFYQGDECLTGSMMCQDLNYVHNMSVKIIARMATIVAMWEHVRNGYDPYPIRKDQPFYPSLDTVRSVQYLERRKVGGYELERMVNSRGGIRHIQVTALKPGIIKSKEEMEGIVLKGVGFEVLSDQVLALALFGGVVLTLAAARFSKKLE